MEKMRYCGPPSLELSQLVGRRTFNSFTENQPFLFYRTRAAISLIAQMLKNLGDCSILMPAYNCGTEISPFVKKGIKCNLYRVRTNLTIDMDDLISQIDPNTQAVYIIHYFGFPHDLKQIKTLCRDKNLILIEDCALSLLTRLPDGRPIGSEGHIALYNFPKMLPVPDGGAMVIHSPDIQFNINIDHNPSISATIKELIPFVKRKILKSLAGTPIFPIVWNHFKKNPPEEEVSDAQYPDMPQSFYYNPQLDNIGMSRITRWLVPRFNEEKIRQLRRRNYQMYLAKLHDTEGMTVLLPRLPLGVCPLYFPILVDNRNKICRYLNKAAIGALPWWPGYHQQLPWMDYSEACCLKNQLLVLPVHHQLSPRDIEYIIKVLVEMPPE